MTKLEDLYFGTKMFNFNTKDFEDHNLFSSIRVLDSIAIYKTNKYVQEKYQSMDDVISFCFSDVRARVQYEFGVCEVFTTDMDRVEKVDLYKWYVEPNKKLLYKMVQDVSVNSCKKWLKDRRAERKAATK